MKSSQDKTGVPKDLTSKPSYLEADKAEVRPPWPEWLRDEVPPIVWPKKNKSPSKTPVERLEVPQQGWWWSRSQTLLDDFEGDPHAQCYEMVRRLPRFHDRLRYNHCDCSKTWLDLSESKRLGFRLEFSRELEALGFTKAPLMMGNEGITFDCSYSPRYLLASVTDYLKNPPPVSNSVRFKFEQMPNNYVNPYRPRGSRLKIIPDELAQSPEWVHLRFPQRKAKLPDVLARLNGARETDEGWEAHCPVHADQRTLLSINLAPTGRMLLRCHAGCSMEALTAAMELTLAEDGRLLRRLYTEEILALFRTVITKPSREFAQYRDQFKMKKRDRLRHARTIAIAIMAWDSDLSGVAYNALAKWLSGARLFGTTEAQLYHMITDAKRLTLQWLKRL